MVGRRYHRDSVDSALVGKTVGCFGNSYNYLLTYRTELIITLVFVE